MVSLDGFIADDRDDVGPLFDWYGNSDVAWSLPGTDDEFRTTQASADFMQSPLPRRGGGGHRTAFVRPDQRQAGGRDVDVAAGRIGGQALKLGLIDQVVVNQVPVVFGSGPAVLCHRSPGRAAAVGEPDHDRARRPGHPPSLRRQPLSPVVVSSYRSSHASALREVAHANRGPGLGTAPALLLALIHPSA